MALFFVRQFTVLVAVVLAAAPLTSIRAFAPQSQTTTKTFGHGMTRIHNQHAECPTSTSSSSSTSTSLGLSPMDIDSTSMTIAPFFETIALGNIIVTTTLFTAGVVATLKQSKMASSDDKDLKSTSSRSVVSSKVVAATSQKVEAPLVADAQDPIVVTTEVKAVVEEAKEPVRVVRNIATTETPLEKEVVKVVNKKKEEKTTPKKNLSTDFNQLKKDVGNSKAPVPEKIMEPAQVAPMDITQLKREIGNTVVEGVKRAPAGIKRSTTSTASAQELQDVKDQVQESLNVVSGGTPSKKGKKRRMVVKVIKKVVMPWKAWKNL
jgi:hypothetical protein